MKRFLIVLIGKIVATLSRLFNIGAGGTWPGEIALWLDGKIIQKLASGVKKGVVLVAGTNGKTTTAKMIGTILKEADSIRHPEFISGSWTREIPKSKIPNQVRDLVRNDAKKIISNKSGANLLNGIASALIDSADIFGKVNADYAVFEVDEASLPLALGELSPKVVICMNLFRDQLDRYGEIDLIAQSWHQALRKLSPEATVILNADDHQMAFLGKDLKAQVLYFGLEDPQLFQTEISHAADSVYCLSCGERLNFKGVYLSHLGIWQCPKCGLKRPPPDLSYWQWLLPGVYNCYNTLAAVLTAKTLGFKDRNIRLGLKKFKPAFGRGEVFKIDGKKVKILLSKNPTGFNATIKRVIEKPQRVVLLALNDRIPDGRDVSWIWDVDFEDLIKKVDGLIVTGDRAYDLGLRIKYAIKVQSSKFKIQNYNSKFKIIQNLKEAIRLGLKTIKKGEILYILPTYSAMLEVRRILGGQKIL